MASGYDLVIVGGGTAGLTAARFAARIGASVAIVEKDRIGGDCTWTGCVPSKALLKAAKVVHEMRTANRFGIEPVNPRVDLARVMSHVRDVILDVYSLETPESLEGEGIAIYKGEARFTDPHTIEAGGNVLNADKALITTGARPLIPSIEGLDGVSYLTYESVWDLKELPERIIVGGAGAIGCELAQAFRRLGSRVTIIEESPRLLPNEESEVSQLLEVVFREEGISLHLNSQVKTARQDGDEIVVTTKDGEIISDALVLAVGRQPVVQGMSLERASIDYDESGIKVDDNLRTSQRHIYAAGDCAGSPQLTHYAGWQGFMAARNALLPGATKGVSEIVPSATYTDPEVAHVGISEAEARKGRGDDVEVFEWPMSRVDRALTDGDARGFIKLVQQVDGTPLGVTIVSENAGEMIAEWVVAMDKGLNVGDLASSMHVYPTYSMATMQMAAEIRVLQLVRGLSRRNRRGAKR